MNTRRGAVCVVVVACVGCQRESLPIQPELASGAVIAANGVTEGARRELAVRPELPGELATLHVCENQEVSAGQLLFEMHNGAEQARVVLARRELEAHRLEAEHAESNWQRASRLLSRQATSVENYETDKWKRDLARARVAEAEARLQLAEAELARTRVHAPFAARVVQVLVEPGASVSPQSELPVLRLADLSRLRVRVFVEELDMARVRLGQPVQITADGLGTRVLVGRVAALAPRMGKSVVHDDAPDASRDLFFREILIDLDEAADLPLNLRVLARIADEP